MQGYFENFPYTDKAEEEAKKNVHHRSQYDIDKYRLLLIITSVMMIHTLLWRAGVIMLDPLRFFLEPAA